jgi:hypothetical protein
MDHMVINIFKAVWKEIVVVVNVHCMQSLYVNELTFRLCSHYTQWPKWFKNSGKSHNRPKKYLWFRFHIVKKLRVGNKFFLNIVFMVLAFFCWAICSRVPTSILTRDAYFLWTNLGNLVLSISVTTDAILARCMNSPQPPGENRVVQSIALKK